MATVQLRNAAEGRAYYDRRRADDKTSMEAMRAVKRRLSNIIYKTMLDDGRPRRCWFEDGPGRTSGKRL